MFSPLFWLTENTMLQKRISAKHLALLTLPRKRCKTIHVSHCNQGNLSLSLLESSIC